jgi:hypothetical protein
MDLLWTVIAVLVILWLLGFVLGIGGVLIHILLVIAVIVLVYRLVKGRNLLTGK